jgi:hypothetical protein
MGFFDRLFGRKGGDGSSPAQAVVVNSVREEYDWLQRNCPGLQFQKQSLVEIDGKPYDVHTLQNAEGEEREVFFNISRFYGKG